VDSWSLIRRPGQEPTRWTGQTGLSGGEHRLEILAPMLASIAAHRSSPGALRGTRDAIRVGNGRFRRLVGVLLVRNAKCSARQASGPNAGPRTVWTAAGKAQRP
jgi:hypothetical protein